MKVSLTVHSFSTSATCDTSRHASGSPKVGRCCDSRIGVFLDLKTRACSVPSIPCSVPHKAQHAELLGPFSVKALTITLSYYPIRVPSRNVLDRLHTTSNADDSTLCFRNDRLPRLGPVDLNASSHVSSPAGMLCADPVLLLGGGNSSRVWVPKWQERCQRHLPHASCRGKMLRPADRLSCRDPLRRW